jgi:hypothetical protein
VKLLLLILLLPILAFAQPQGPDTLWTHEYLELGHCTPWAVLPDRHGGMTLVGMVSTGYINAIDGEVIGLGATGDTLWTRRFGFPTSDDYVWSGVRTNDGGAVFPLECIDNLHNDYLGTWVVKLDSLGDSLWSTRLDWGDRSFGYFYGTIETRNRDLVLAGDSDEGPCAIRLNAQGDTLWVRDYNPFGYSIKIAGLTELSSGHILLIGTLLQPEGNAIATCICVDSTGDTVWTRAFPLPAGLDYIHFDSVIPLRGDSALVAGYAISGDTSYTALFKIDEVGNLIWWHPYAIAGRNFASDAPIRLVLDSDSGYVISLTTFLASTDRGDGTLWKIDREGDMRWCRIVSGPDWAHDYSAKAVAIHPAGGYVWDITTTHYTTVLRLASEAAITPHTRISIPSSISIQSVYPNPFNVSTTITFELARRGNVSLAVHDVLGRQVAVLEDGVMDAGEHRVVFDGGGLASGIYFCTLRSGGKVATGKMVLLK